MLDEGLDEGLRRVSVSTQYTPLQHGVYFRWISRLGGDSRRRSSRVQSPGGLRLPEGILHVLYVRTVCSVKYLARKKDVTCWGGWRRTRTL